MAQETKPGVLKVIDLAALQKHIGADAVQKHMSNEVIEARQSMLLAMERNNAAMIVEAIQAVEEKLIALTSYGKNTGSEELAAYRHIAHIGRIALLGLSPSAFSPSMPAEPIRNWDA